MNVTEVKQKENTFHVYVVTLKPNWLEKLFGYKEKREEYKDTGSTYTFGGGHVYMGKDGDRLDNCNLIGEAIDRWRRKW